MTKAVVNYHYLLGLLQTFEKDHQLHKEMMNLVGGSSSDGRHLFKKEKKNKIKKYKVLGVRPRSPSSRLIRVDRVLLLQKAGSLEEELSLISSFY